MSKYIRQMAAPLALTFALFAGACTTEKKDDQLAQDSAALNRDLNLANTDTAAKPALQDVPATTTPAPAATTPRTTTPRTTTSRTTTTPRTTTPAPRPSNTTASGNKVTTGTGATTGGAVGSIASGTTINLTSTQRICTNTNSVGDRFTAQIADPVMGANGTVIPVGATAVVSITSLHRSEKAGENIEIGLRVESISYAGKTYPVSSETTYAQVDRVRAESSGETARKVATGAAIGAVLGQILGHKTKSTVIGAGAGAAAGAVIANRNADYDGCVPTGGRITIRLTEPLTIQLTE